MILKEVEELKRGNVRKEQDVAIHVLHHAKQYTIWKWIMARFEFFAVLHDRSKLFLSLRPVVSILKMRGKKKKDIRKNESRKHPSDILNSLVRPSFTGEF